MGRTSKDKQVSNRKQKKEDIKEILDFRQLNSFTEIAPNSEILIRKVPGNSLGKISLKEFAKLLDLDEDGELDVTLRPTFETVSQNLQAYDGTFGYTGKDLTSITYNLGNGNIIVKTFTYTGKDITKITLSGTLPDGIQTQKNITYTGKDITSISYI